MESKREYFLKKAWLLVFIVGAPAVTAQADQCAMDFEGLSAGTVVTELSVGAGISGCTSNKVVAVSSQNCKFSSEAAIVFDSSCTVTPTSQCEFIDQDIGTPHQDFGGPGRGDGGCATCAFPNDTPLGNILVLANDKVDNFNNITGASGSDGLVDDPDDADCNGYMQFDFTDVHPNGVTIDAVTVLDIEFDEGESPAVITLSKASGPPSTFIIEDTGDGGKATFDSIGIENVTQMQVEFKGSGAFAGAFFDAPELVRAC